MQLLWVLVLFSLLAAQAADAKIVELTDGNFQHLTQAGKGATTGNWFVLFCNSESEACSKITPVWEELDKALKDDNPGGIVLGHVGTKESFAVSRRFRIPPDNDVYILLFKGNYLTLYTGAKTFDEMKAFADTIGSSASKWVGIPPEMHKVEAFMEEVVAQSRQVFNEKPMFFWGVLSGGFILGFITHVVIAGYTSEKKPKVKDVKKKDSKAD